ncbi:MAG TPA: hypothetical protein VMW76_04090 [Bacteroidales bacterium]|nr:hypothetical protein [Bacteroidales bacterium]
MEDIGVDIIFYIIAGMIAIVGALARKKRKPAPARIAGDSSMQTRKKFDEILEDIITGGEGDTLKQSEPDFWNADADETETDDQMEELVLSAGKEGGYSEPMAEEFSDEGSISEVSAFSNEGVSVTEQAVGEIGLTDTSSAGNPDSWAAELAEDFDLPRAIVYSEILTRKEYF